MLQGWLNLHLYLIGSGLTEKSVAVQYLKFPRDPVRDQPQKAQKAQKE